MDIAELGFGVDTSGLVQGVAALDQLETQAHQTAQAAASVGTATSGVAAEIARILTPLNSMAARLESLDTGMEKLVGSSGESKAMTAALAGSMDKLSATADRMIQVLTRLETTKGANARADANSAAQAKVHEQSITALQTKYDKLAESIGKANQKRRESPTFGPEAPIGYKMGLTQYGPASPFKVGSEQYGPAQPTPIQAKVGAEMFGPVAPAQEWIKELDRLASTLTPLQTQLRAVEAAERKLADAQRMGAPVTDQHRAAVAKMRQSYREAAGETVALGKSSAATAQQLGQMTPQINDIFTSLTGGMSPFMVLTQQGPQITQIFGGLKGTFMALLAAVTPLGLAVGVLGGAFVAAGLMAESQDRALRTLQNRLMGTTADYQGLAASIEAAAKKAAATTDITKADARQVLQVVFTSLGAERVQQDMDGILSSVQALAKGMGEDMEQAGKRYVAAVRDPTKAAQGYLEDSTRGFNDALVRQIQLLQLSGDRAGASRLVLEQLSKTYGATTDNLTPLQRATNELANKFSELWGSVGPVVTRLGTEFIQTLITTVREVGKIIEAVASFVQLMRDLRDLIPGAAAAYAGVTPQGAVSPGNTAAGEAAGAAGQVLMNREKPGNTAAGLFQVTAGAAAHVAQLGIGSYDTRDPQQNIMAGLAYYREMRKPGGYNALTMASLYNQGPNGNPNSAGAQEYQRKLAAVDLSKLPEDVGKAIEDFGATLLLTAREIEVAKRIVMVESSGNHYVGGVGMRPGAVRASTERQQFGPAVPDELLRAPTAIPTPPPAAPAAGQSSVQLEIEDMMKRLRELGTRSATVEATKTEIGRIEKMLADPKFRGAMTPEQQTMATEGLQSLRAKLEGLKDPIEAHIQGLERTAAASAQLDPVTAKLADAMATLDKVARDNGRTASADERRRVTLSVLKEQDSSYRKLIDTTDRATAQQVAVADAYKVSTQAGMEAEATARALEAVRGIYVSGSPAEQAAVAELARKYKEQADAANALFLAKESLNQRDQLELVEAEGRLLSANTAEREREMAVIRARQGLVARNVDLSTQEAQAYLSNVARMTDAQSQLNAMKSAMAEFQQIGTSAFEKVGDAITDAFVSGQGKMVDFGNILKGLLAQVATYIAKITLLNPLMNSLTGGSATTIGTLASAFSGGVSGGAGSGLMSVVQGFFGRGATPTPTTDISGAAARAAASGPSGFTGMASVAANGQTASTSTLMDAASGAKGLLGGGKSGVSTGLGWIDRGLASEAYNVGGSSVSYGTALGGAAGVAGGAYGIYSGIKTGGAKGWAQGIGGAASVVSGGAALAGIGGAATGVGVAGAAATGVAAAGGGVAAGAAAAGATGVAAGGAAAGALATVAAVAPYIAVLALVASYFLSGQKPSDKTGVFKGNLATGTSEVGGLTGDRFSQENRDTATAMGQQISSVAGMLRTAMGVSTTPFNYEVAVGDRDGLKATYGGKDRRYNADEAGSKQLIDDMTRAMIDSMRGMASAEVNTVIDRSGGDTAKIMENLDWYQNTYKPAAAAPGSEAEAMTSRFQQGIKELTGPIDEVIAKARELGLSETQLAANRDAAVKKLEAARQAEMDAFSDDLETRRAVAMGQGSSQTQVRRFDVNAQKEASAAEESLKNWDVRGASFTQAMDSVWATLNAERAQLVRQISQQTELAKDALNDRTLNAEGGATGLDMQLAIADRNAYREREQAALDGNQNLVMLDRALAAERLAIQRNFNEQMAATNNALWDRVRTANGTANGLQGRLDGFDTNAATEWVRATRDGMTDLTLLAQTQALERLAIERDYGEQMLAVNNGLWDRIRTANETANTRQGALDAYDVGAQAEWVKAARDGMTDLTLLARTQAEERLAIERRFAEADAAMRLSLNDRIFAATNDTSTASGQLAAFDRKAAQERKAAARAGNVDMVLLEEALGAERLQIQRDYGKQQAEAMRSAGQGIRQFLDSLKTGSEFGSTPTSRLEASQEVYQRDLTLAQGGDMEASNRVANSAAAYLTAAKDVFASGQGFQDVLASVSAALTALPATKSYDQMILEALNGLGQGIEVEVGVGIVRTITEAINGLSEAEKGQLVQAATVLRTIEEALGRQLTDAEKLTLIQSESIMRLIGQALGRQLTEDERNSLLGTLTVYRTIEQAIGRQLSSDERASLVATTSVLWTVNQALGRDLTTAERNALIGSATVLRSIEQALGRVLTDTEKAQLQTGGVIPQSVQQALGRVLTDTEKAQLQAGGTLTQAIAQALGRQLTSGELATLAKGGTLVQSIDQSLGRALTSAEIASMAKGGSILQSVEQALGRKLTADETATLVTGGAISRTISQALGRVLTDSERLSLVNADTVIRSIQQQIGRQLTSAELASLIGPGDITRTVSQSIETTETVEISRSIDDKIGASLLALAEIARSQLAATGDGNRALARMSGQDDGIYIRLGNEAKTIFSTTRDLTYDMNQRMAGANFGIVVRPGQDFGVFGASAIPIYSSSASGVIVQANSWAHNNTSSIVKFAKGGVFDEGMQVAVGGSGIVSQATNFAMADGRTGQMGEAGPEAIMPLKRGRDGSLGVRVEMPQINRQPVIVMPDHSPRGDDSGELAMLRQQVADLNDTLRAMAQKLAQMGQKAEMQREDMVEAARDTAATNRKMARDGDRRQGGARA